MPFFHIPWGSRLAIALLLNLNIAAQLVHQVLKFVWSGVVLYNEQPQGYIGAVTGPIAGCLFGGSAAAVQVYWDYVLHKREPDRFPPDLVRVFCNFLGGDKLGVEEEARDVGDVGDSCHILRGGWSRPAAGVGHARGGREQCVLRGNKDRPHTFSI